MDMATARKRIEEQCTMLGYLLSPQQITAAAAKSRGNEAYGLWARDAVIRARLAERG